MAEFKSNVLLPRFSGIWTSSSLFCATLAVILLLDSVGFLTGINQYIYDHCLRLRGPLQPSDRIIVAAVDQRSLDRLGRWPIPRRHYAALLQNLQQADAVAFDILFVEPSKDDAQLAAAMRRHGRVVLPVFIDLGRNIVTPAEELACSALGHVHLEQDSDGVIRKLFHTISYQGMAMPSLASATLAVVLDRDRPRRRPGGAGLAGRSPDIIRQTDGMRIKYYGGQGVIPAYSLVDILEGKWPPSFFRNKIVILGLTAPGLQNARLTPWAPASGPVPEVEIHAQILNNLLAGQSIRKIGFAPRWILTFLISGIFFILFMRRAGVRAMGIWVISLAMLTGFVYLSLTRADRWWPLTSGYFALTAAFVLSYVLNLAKAQRLLFQARADWEESFNTIEDAISIHAPDGTVLKANTAAREVFGAPLLDLLKQRCLELCGDNSGPCTYQGKAARPAGEEGLTTELFASEMGKYIEIRSQPRFDRQHRFKGMVQVVRDITRRKQAQEEHARMQMQLIQAQKMEAIGTLAGGIAHDFNNILSAIMGYTQLVSLKLSEDSPARPQLDHVLQACERAKNLVGQILAFSRRTKEEKKPVMLGPLIKEVSKLLRASLPSTLTLQTNVEGEAIWVMADPSQIHQILMNLCTNAAHAMRGQGGTLEISLEPIDVAAESAPPHADLTPGPYVNIRVRDEGRGMAPETLAQIFNPYFTTKGPGQGTGLGLAVVHGIVKDHGGAVRVDSTPGEGTTFEVFLPRILHEPDASKHTRRDTPGGTERILVVDDEPMLVEIWKQMIERLGYQVTAAAGSAEALEIFHADPSGFDLVITDMTMPGMCGDQLARKILAVRPEIPILLCTGFSEQITAERAAAMGIRRLLFKPLAVGDLARTIRIELDRGQESGGRD